MVTDWASTEPGRAVPNMAPPSVAPPDAANADSTALLLASICCFITLLPRLDMVHRGLVKLHLQAELASRVDVQADEKRLRQPVGVGTLDAQAGRARLCPERARHHGGQKDRRGLLADRFDTLPQAVFDQTVDRALPCLQLRAQCGEPLGKPGFGPRLRQRIGRLPRHPEALYVNVALARLARQELGERLVGLDIGHLDLG